jgi:hypothetical protein
MLLNRKKSSRRRGRVDHGIRSNGQYCTSVKQSQPMQIICSQMAASTEDLDSRSSGPVTSTMVHSIPLWPDIRMQLRPTSSYFVCKTTHTQAWVHVCAINWQIQQSGQLAWSWVQGPLCSIQNMSLNDLHAWPSACRPRLWELF